MGYSLTDEAYDALKKQADSAKEYKLDLEAVQKLVVAACRCGFTGRDQEDALLFALERITKEPRVVLRALIDAPPKGYNGR